MTVESTAPAAPEEAPPVVAVVVVRDPGPWFEEALSALGAQDYPALSILVIDAGSDEDPTDRVAATLPSAFVRRLAADPGLAASADEVLDVVKGASHLLFCHDDVAPDPSAVRLLLEGAFRQNAGIVAPKIVDWDRPERLQSLGEGADALGRLIPMVEPGELDQGQHDGDREVLSASSACLLVRADLFARLGGFDRALVLGGEDLDLCWRAACAGARTVTAPAARVRHRGALARGERTSALGDPRELEARARLRAALVAAPRVRFLPTILLAAVTAVLEAVTSVALGRRHRARTALATVAWNLTNLGSTLAARRRLRRHRTGDGMRLVSRRGRFGAVVRDVAAEGDDPRTASQIIRDGFATWWAGGIGRPLLVLAGVAVVLAIGSRDLLGAPMPSVGTLAPLPHDPFELLRSYASGSRLAGLGGVGSAPGGFAVLGLASLVLLGGTGLVSAVVVFGSLVVGLLGAGRLARPLGSGRATAAAVLVYAAVPLWYDALATGSMGGLISFAVAPWVLLRLFRGSGIAPFGATAAAEEGAEGSALAEVARLRAGRRAHAPRASGSGAGGLEGDGPWYPEEPEERTSAEALSDTGPEHALDEMGAFGEDIDLADLGRTRAQRRRRTVRHQLSPPPVPTRTAWQQAVALGVVLALAVALAPALLPAVAVVVIGFVLSGLLVGELGGLRRGALVVARSALVALGLTAPWSIEVLRAGQWSALVGAAPPPGTAPSAYDLLRLSLGPLPVGPLPLLILLAAALPLATGAGWRLGWACRCWSIALVLIGVVLAWGRGWIPLTPIAPAVLLPFAAAALALSVALGAAAFEVDLPGYRFGWRQVASLGAALAVVISAGPVLIGTHTGRWATPGRSTGDVLGWMSERVGDGPFRVLWVGDARTLPLTGWSLGDGLAFATSRNGPPRATDEWAGPRKRLDDALGDPISAARRREVVDLGHRLAPLGVRYIVVPLRTAPDHGRAALVPADLIAGLADQVDLKPIEANPSVAVYENAAWIAGRAQVPAAAVAEASRIDGDPSQVDLATGAAVLAPQKPGSLVYKDPLAVGEVLLAEASSSRWSLEVAGRPADRHTAFSTVNGFTVRSAGRATLRFRTPFFHWVALLLQLVLWAAALWSLVRAVGSGAAAGRVARSVVALGPEPAPQAQGGVVLLPRVEGVGLEPVRAPGWDDLLVEPELEAPVGTVEAEIADRRLTETPPLGPGVLDATALDAEVEHLDALAELDDVAGGAGGIDPPLEQPEPGDTPDPEAPR